MKWCGVQQAGACPPKVGARPSMTTAWEVDTGMQKHSWMHIRSPDELSGSDTPRYATPLSEY
jgi:hypothetical protein